jgi:nucleotide-binding universal stress UspA family protein
MNKINRILFPTDFSEVAENAFQHAIFWAMKYHADIHVVSIYNPYIPIGEYGAGSILLDAPPIENDAQTLDRLTLFIEKGIMKVITNRVTDFFPKIDSSIQSGVIDTVICKMAKGENFDMIIMGTRGESHDYLDKVIGTTSHQVVENAYCPVLLIPSHIVYKEIDKVVFASDLKATQPYRIWQSYEMLKVFDPTFHCVHVRTDNAPQELQLYELDNYFKEAHPTIPIQFHLVHLDSIEEGMKLTVNLWNAELLCMYTPHHSIFQQLFIKSNSQNAIDYMNVPLLFLKPQKLFA